MRLCASRSGLREMNIQMSKENLNLTKALKGDSKMQGNWGELVPERVPKKSGLRKVVNTKYNKASQPRMEIVFGWSSIARW
jgi:DNA anti-recombination protein RmuC